MRNDHGCSPSLLTGSERIVGPAGKMSSCSGWCCIFQSLLRKTWGRNVWKSSTMLQARLQQWLQRLMVGAALLRLCHDAGLEPQQPGASKQQCTGHPR